MASMLERTLPARGVDTVSRKALSAGGLECGSPACRTAVATENDLRSRSNDSKADTYPSKPTVIVETQPINPLTADIDLKATHVKSSPYDDHLDYLDLRELSKPDRLFALALRKIQPTRGDYATSTYMSTFNWHTIFETLGELCSEARVQWQNQTFYVVIFRSRLREGADRKVLGELDQMSHQEACASGGLLHYWFGSPDAEMRNLATCRIPGIIFDSGEDPEADSWLSRHLT